MADGVQITAGSGVTIGTDDCGAAGQIQFVKLAVSANGDGTPSPVTTDGVAVVVRPETSGGLSTSRTVSAATTNATSVKGSAGQVYGWYLSNVNAAARYVKLYNKATAPTVGSDTPVLTLMVPSGGGSNAFVPQGVAFSTGIAFAITTGAADSDTGAVAANEIVVNLLYK
jgi:hypothetical protein